MAGYPYLQGVTDPAIYRALKQVFDQLNSLTTRVTTLESTTLKNTAAITANGQRITNVADPQADSDAATTGYVKQYVAARTGQ